MHYLPKMQMMYLLCSSLYWLFCSGENLNRDCSNKSSRPERAPNQSDDKSDAVLLYSIWMQTASSGGSGDCKLLISYVQVIYVLERQNKAFLKHVQQTAWKRICYYQSWCSKWPFAQPASLFAKIRNEIDSACMIHPPYSVAHADLEIHSMRL